MILLYDRRHMDLKPDWKIELAPGVDQLFAKAQIDPSQAFSDPRIQVWRDLPERQNCYLDLTLGGAKPMRLHIKRFKPPHGQDARREVDGIRLLNAFDIATVPLMAWGTHPDGRSFLMTRDLAGFVPADRLIRETKCYQELAPHIANVAARLHSCRLHHRDLYLCHFLVRRNSGKVAGAPYAIHLIDAGRVSRLPIFPFNLRWIVKDLAQLMFSLSQLEIPPAQRRILLDHYFAAANIPLGRFARWLIPLKVAAIARHDRQLARRQPTRNISID